MWFALDFGLGSSVCPETKQKVMTALLCTMFCRIGGNPHNFAIEVIPSGEFELKANSLGALIETHGKLILRTLSYLTHSENKCCYFHTKINAFWLHFSNMFKRLYPL